MMLARSRAPDDIAAAGVCFAAFRQIIVDAYGPEGSRLILERMLAPTDHTIN